MKATGSALFLDNARSKRRPMIVIFLWAPGIRDAGSPWERPQSAEPAVAGERVFASLFGADCPRDFRWMSERQRHIPPKAPSFPPLASWIRKYREGTPSFSSGAALSALDPIARSDHPLGALWRQRLALKCAGALVQHIGRDEGEREIRDHFYFTKLGNSGPAGQIFATWLDLARFGMLRDRSLPVRLAKSFELPPSAANSIEDIFAATPERQGNPVQAAAEIALMGLRLFPQVSLLAPWLVDATLSVQLRWPAPVPLIASHIKRRDLRHALDDGEDWLKACHDAYAGAASEAVELYIDLARRSERLIDVAPKLRSHEADRIVERLLAKDALLVEAGKYATDRSIRRLFDRLVELGAVREFTGRSSFRLYGI